MAEAQSADDFLGSPSTPSADDFLGSGPSAAPPEETASRVAGLGARALGSGVAGLAGIPQLAADAMSMNPMGVEARKTAEAKSEADSGPYKPSLSDFVHPERWQKAAEYFADQASNSAGLPTPETPAERIGSKAVAALPSAVLAPEAPIAGALSSAVGATASQGAKEAGAGPVAQTLAGLAGGFAPGAAVAGPAAAFRGIVRGGASGKAEMESNIADASQAGTSLSAGQAGGSGLVQYAEGLSSKGWGGGPINKLATKQTGDLSNSVDRIVNNLSQGTDPSPTVAGEAINKGAATSAVNMRAAEKAAYDKVDTLVPPTTPISVSNTLKMLDSLATPTPGAEATTGSLISPKIAELRKNLTADAAAHSAANGGAAALPYDAVKQVRSAVGENIDHGFAPADPSTNGSYKQIYKALSADMEAGASAVSPAAKQAASDASSLYKANSARREFLDTIVNKNGGPEAVYQAATNGTKQGATKISGVMKELDPSQQDMVRATVLNKLGKANPSAQNADGDAFNPNTFLTNWSKIDSDAKDAMFGAQGTSQSLRSNLDSIAKTTDLIRSGTKLRNPSGSGDVVGHGAGAIALWEGLSHLFTGHPGYLAATASGVAANNLMARALTNPKTVDWLAKSTKLPTSGLPNAVNQLSQINDPDAQDLSSYLNQPPRAARASGGKVDHEALVERLISTWKKARKDTNEATKPLLSVPDAAIVKALDIAGRAI